MTFEYVIPNTNNKLRIYEEPAWANHELKMIDDKNIETLIPLVLNSNWFNEQQSIDKAKDEVKKLNIPSTLIDKIINKLIKNAAKQQKQSTTTSNSGYTLDTEGLGQFAAKLMETMRIKVLRGSSRDTRTVYVLSNGFYHSGGDIDIELACKEEFGNLYEYSLFKKVYDHILSTNVLESWEFKQPQRTLNIDNGILVYKDNKVKFHPRNNPLEFCDMNFTYKLPLIYDPKAECPNIEALIQQILIDKSIDVEHLKVIEVAKAFNEASLEEQKDPEFQAEYTEQMDKAIKIATGEDPAVAKLFTFYEFLGMCLMSEYEFKHALLLLGQTHTGKSTLLNIMRKFVGEQNSVTVPIDKMDSSKNRFAAARLNNRFLNACEELPRISINSFDLLKAATSGATMDVESKGVEGKEIINRAKFIFCGNETPTVNPQVFDSTMDRFIAIECTNRFMAAEETTNSELKGKEFTHEEMSGLLNIAIRHLERLLESGGKFTAYDNSMTPILWNKYNNWSEQNPVRTFIKECCEVTGSKKDCISRTELWEEYQKYVKNNKDEEFTNIDNNEFSHQVALYKESYTDKWGKNTNEYKCIGTKKTTERIWTGITLKACVKLSINETPDEESDPNGGIV